MGTVAVEVQTVIVVHDSAPGIEVAGGQIAPEKMVADCLRDIAGMIEPVGIEVDHARYLVVERYVSHGHNAVEQDLSWG